jgi:hypothetical protein
LTLSKSREMKGSKDEGFEKKYKQNVNEFKKKEWTMWRNMADDVLKNIFRFKHKGCPEDRIKPGLIKYSKN